MADPSAQEVLMMELINRARLDPAGEAARFGIDLNEGLPPATISTTSKQPLAWSIPLFNAADAHSQSMIDNDYFAHVDPTTGSTPQSRANAAGYSGPVGENIAFVGTTGTLDPTGAIISQHEDLFVDSGIDGRGHRLNILDDGYREAGIGQALGVFTTGGTSYNASMVTQDFGVPGAGGQFITGVAYNDSDGNAFYSVGEGRPAVSVSTSSGGFVTRTAGDYGGAIGGGLQTVTFSGGDVGGMVSLNATILAGRNAKIDLVGPSTIMTSTSISENQGIATIVGLGNIGLTLTGDGGADTISGTAGNDTIFGEGGLDAIAGGAGNDTLVAHSAADLFAQEADSLTGGTGDDTLYGDAFDSLNGGAGFDVLQVINGYDVNLDLVAAGIEYVVSEFGNDTYTAASGATAVEVYGSGGNDSITGGAGNDNLWGGVGNDTLTGNNGDDLLVGDLGADRLSGGAGNDRLYIDPSDTLIDGGGGGFDAAYIIGGGGMTLNMATANLDWVTDFVNGNDGIDASGTSTGVEIYAGGGTDNLTGGSGNDLIFAGTGNDTLTGGDGADALIGQTGADSLSGGNGNDRLYIDPSDTFIDGGAGFDIAFIESGAGMTINMSTSSLEYVQDLAGGNDSINAAATSAGVSIFAGGGTDSLIGGSGNDTLWAGSGNDMLTGNAGNDTLVGEAGIDRLIGGAGNDTLNGGTEADRFVWTTGGNTDTVTSWEDGSDKLEFNGVAGLDDASDLTVVNNGGNAEVYSGADLLFVVVGAAGQINSGDYLFS